MDGETKMSHTDEKQSAEFDAIRMIYELARILMDECAPDAQSRLCEMRNHIRSNYDESVWHR